MLKIVNVEHLHKVLKEIEECDVHAEDRFRTDFAGDSDPPFLLSRFEQQLKYLHHYGDGDWLVELGWDFAKWSFRLNWYRCGGHVFNGGLIFHNGTGMNDDSLSVELNPPKGPHWSVHT